MATYKIPSLAEHIQCDIVQNNPPFELCVGFFCNGASSFFVSTPRQFESLAFASAFHAIDLPRSCRYI